jgi:O-antigen/teichoic acid export membrane protein
VGGSLVREVSDAPAPHREVRHGMVYLATVVIGNLFPLVTLPIYTRLVTPAEYGLFAIATAYATIVAGIGQLGLAQGYEREYFARAHRDGGVGLLTSVLLYAVAALGVLAVGTAFLADAIATRVLHENISAVLLVATFVSVALQALRQFVLTYFRNRTEAVVFATYSLSEATLWAVLGIWFVAGLKLGILGIPLGQAVGSAVVFAVMLAHVYLRTPPTLDGAGFRSALTVAVPLTPRILLGVASSQFDKYMIGLLGTAASVGIYAVGQRLSYAVFTYMTALENVFAPRTMSMMFDDPVHGGARIGRYLTPFAYLSVAVAFVIAIFAEELLWLLTDEAYWGGAPVISVLAVFYTWYFFSKQRQLIYARKAHLISALSVAGFALNVGLNIPLIQAWGALGAALGTCCAGALSVLLTVRVAQRYYRIEYEGAKLTAIYGSLIAATALTLVLGALEFPYGPRLVVKLVLLGGFLALGHSFGVVSRASIRMVRDAVVRRARPATAGT